MLFPAKIADIKGFIYLSECTIFSAATLCNSISGFDEIIGILYLVYRLFVLPLVLSPLVKNMKQEGFQKQ